MVGEAHDVVFAQVAARLHFDDLQGQLARVRQPVHLTQRDVGALVFAQQQYLVAVGDFGRAADHHPVLGTVVVLLQRERGTGLDGDALDLVARSGVDAVVPAPGARHTAVLHGLAGVELLQARDDFLDGFGVRGVGHQQGVGGVDDEQVFGAQGDHRALAGGVYVGVARSQVVSVRQFASGTVTVRVRGGQLGHRVPAADIAPGAGKGEDADVGRMFHHGVVDGLAAAGGEGSGVGAQKQPVADRRGHGLAAGVEDVGGMRLQGLQERAGADQEDAGIPQVLAAGQQLQRLRLGRLFDKARDRKAALLRRPFLDVAVGGAGETGLDAKGDHLPLRGGGHRAAHHGAKALHVGDMVVGGTKQQQRIGGRRQHCQRHGCRRIPCHRLQDLAHLQTGTGRRIGNQEAVLLRGHTGDGVARHQRRQALQRQLQQRLVAEQGNELFREGFARQGPQAGAAAAAEDDGANHACSRCKRGMAHCRCATALAGPNQPQKTTKMIA